MGGEGIGNDCLMGKFPLGIVTDLEYREWLCNIVTALNATKSYNMRPFK